MTRMAFARFPTVKPLKTPTPGPFGTDPALVAETSN